MNENLKKSLRQLVQNYQAKWMELDPTIDAARNSIDKIGATVSEFRPVEFIPLVVLWVSKSLQGQDFFSFLKSASFDKEIADIIQKAKDAVSTSFHYDEQKLIPYEVLLTESGLCTNSYHRFKPSISNFNIFKKQLYYLLYNTIFPFKELLNERNFYRPSDSERPNWVAFLTIGANRQTHDLTFAMSLTQHAFFDPRLGEFHFKGLKILTDFIGDFLFEFYANYCSSCFCYVMDWATPIDFSKNNLHSKYTDRIRVESQDMVWQKSVKCCYETK